MKLATKLAVAMILLVTVTVSAVGLVSYLRLERALLPRVLYRLEAHSQLLAAELESYVAGARGDIESFRSAALTSLVRAHVGHDPLDGTAAKVWHDRVATRLTSLVEVKPSYAIFRIVGLDDGARELVRVDRSGRDGTVRVAPDNELQQMSGQAFVAETSRMLVGEIYVSPITLERDMPVMRIAAPIFEPEGRPFGVIAVDVDMRAVFDRVRGSMRMDEQVYVVGRDGEYFVHPDRTREFSGLSGNARWQNDFPSFAALVGTQRSIAQDIEDRNGRLAGAALASALLAGKEWVGVIRIALNPSLVAAKAIQQISISVGLIAVLCAAALAVLLARSLTRPIGQLTAAVESIGRGKPRPVPVEATGETGVLARAFARMIHETSAKTTALEREILERRLTEAARDHHAQRERLLNAAVQSAEDAIITQTLDGTIAGWNPAAQRLFGYSADEAIGKSIYLIVPPDNKAEMQETLRRIANGERVKHHETVRLRKDGSRVEVWVSISPIKSPSGEIIGAAKIARDITQTRKTERALQLEIEERRRIFEASQDLILITDSRGVVVQASPSCETILGYKPEELIGRNAAEIIHPGDLEMAREDLRTARRSGRSSAPATRLLHKDGHAVMASFLSTWSEPVKRYFCVARDITQTRMTERALQREIEERRRIFEASQDLILITDSRGTVVQASPSSEMIAGYRPEEIIGRNTAEFIHPDDLEMSREDLRAARRGERSRVFDTRILHKDGHLVTLSCLGTWSEPVERYFFVARDMTESRRAEENLRESEQLSRNIIETALDAFVQIDDRFRILNWNSQAEKIFGWSQAEALGKNAVELIVGEADRKAVRSGLKRTAGEGFVGRRREIRALRRDGKQFKAEVSITALRRREGMLFNGFFRDLTDKIAAEERIRQSEKMEALGQLTGGVAHDFNNILTVITGTIEILADAVAKEPQLAAVTRMIDEAAARGAELTQHLLAFARRQPLQPREIDVKQLIIGTAKLLRPTLGEHIQIETTFEDAACVAIVDPNQLTTAILNLALNARDAMPEGGKLMLETGLADLDENSAAVNDVRPGRYVVISVSDSGSGIPAGMLDKVFDPFFTSKGPGKGTGLGLSMVYGFVKQSAGDIKVYSEPGHGTTIKMFLPAGESATAAMESVSPETIGGGNETILVVEDDRLVRRYVLTQLHSLGYVTLEAANAAEALEIVAAGKQFDLLFTDIVMPGAMNGRQLTDELKKIRPGSKVLYTSGYTENAIIHHGQLDPGVVLLSKPYRKSDLARSIRKVLDG